MNPGTNIPKATFVATGTYNNQVLRPYDTKSIDQQTVNQFKSDVEAGLNINTISVAPYSNKILSPSAQYEGYVNIDEGWNTPRLRFIIEVDEVNATLGRAVGKKILQGYTSHIGVSHSGAIDPNMILYFNTITGLRINYRNTPYGLYPNYVLEGSYYFTHKRINPQNNQMYHLMTPTSIISGLERNNISNFVPDALPEYIIDTRIPFQGSSIAATKRIWGDSNNYFSDVLKSIYNSYNNPQLGFFEDLTVSSKLGEERSKLKDYPLNIDTFFNTLIQNSNLFATSGCISYGEIITIFPQLNAVASFHLPNEARKINNYDIHTTGQTEYWETSTLETNWVSQLTHSLPGLMLNYLISRISLNVTNCTVNNQIIVNVLDVNSVVENFDVRSHVHHFIEYLKHSLFVSLSMNNLIEFNINLMIDIKGDSRFMISLNQQPPVEYVSPSFSDSLFNPMFTTNDNRINVIQNDLRYLSNVIATDSLYPTQPKYSQQNDLNQLTI